ncbi:proprotein convertase subtilisin/kexin type 9-like [Glandiceps talaboti]
MRTTLLVIVVVVQLIELNIGLSSAEEYCVWPEDAIEKLTTLESRIEGVEKCSKCKEPTCVTRWSSLSATNDDAQGRVRCEHDEVMTGCSSYLPGNAHGSRDGEFIEVGSDGIPTCVARNGAGGSGVKAAARCCNWPEMKCTYKSGSKSGNGDDNRSTVSCSEKIDGMDAYLTGCMALTAWKQLDGAKPNSATSGQLSTIDNGECFAYNGHGGGGVWAYAACCASGNLECKAKWSSRSGGGVRARATVSCDAGWTMTGCSVYTPYKVTDGAFIEEAKCIAVNGGNNNYVYAIAICCK